MTKKWGISLAVKNSTKLITHLLPHTASEKKGGVQARGSAYNLIITQIWIPICKAPTIKSFELQRKFTMTKMRDQFKTWF